MAKRKDKVAPSKLPREKLDELGDDAFFARVANGESYTRIAESLGIRHHSIEQWIAASDSRSARALEVRTATGKVWDEKAERVLESAADPFELAKAKELAHHYRWRSSKVAPKVYGDKQQVEHTGKDGSPLSININLGGKGDK